MDPEESNMIMASEEHGVEISDENDRGPEHQADETRVTAEEETIGESAQGSNHPTTSVNQEENDTCYICKKAAEENTTLKKFNNQTWATAKKYAALRKNFSSDKYSCITQQLLKCGSLNSTCYYHPPCYRVYTAVKRPREPSAESNEPAPKKSLIATRRSSGLQKSDQQGLLKGYCIFCGKSRKKKNRKEENRIQIVTDGGCDTLRQRAHLSKNDRVKSLILSGEDLIAKEAEYHKSCWMQFMKETEQSRTEQSPTQTSVTYHRDAFAAVLTFIQNEVIEKQRSFLISDLLNMYKEEYVSLGGCISDVRNYVSQSLTRKISAHLNEAVRISMADNRRGNYIFSSAIAEEDAILRIHEDVEKLQEEMKLRWAALRLRSVILNLPKTKTPSPTTVHNLKECAPDVPAQLEIFFKTLLCGMKTCGEEGHSDGVDRKVTSLSSDAIFNVSRGTVKPWKHTALGLGFASLTGSKLAMQILNRTGHCISYDDAKGLETEFAYSVEEDQRDTPDGIRLDPTLATASVIDNNDANMETPDGKQTVHATVGHTYQNIMQDEETTAYPMMFRDGPKQRKFVGSNRSIPPFRKPIKQAKFHLPATATSGDDSFTASSSADDTSRASASGPTNVEEHPDSFQIQLRALDLYWFCKLKEGGIPLHAGFTSKYMKDPLPLQRICYMDPISKSPTNNDVVRETMIRSLNVAHETGQEYAVVTYDLAVALKAYSIQAIETPLFDKLLIMLGNFHIELAFYGAVGTLINECGIEFILTEAGILAEGSMMGFIKGKFYNRCTRIHELLANVLEQKMYQQFLLDIPEEDLIQFQQVISTAPSDPQKVEEYLKDPVVTHHLQLYEKFFLSVLNGDHGSMAKFWGIYIFLINRLHRELQRCVKTNDVRGYIKIFPMMLAVFFALNRPNYARWGTLFLQKLKSADPKLLEVLEKGAFSIRRTSKNYSRSAVDLSLEQTVNRDAASSMKGIVAFRNSESAMRRWCMTMNQRAMVVTELRSFAGLEIGESAASQCQPARIKRDNKHMDKLSAKIDEFCNPFTDEAPQSLVNIATGQQASEPTESYLLNTLERGQNERDKFFNEWVGNNNRFLQPIKRTRVDNFAAQNAKKTKKAKLPSSQKAKTNAESLRDMFVRIIIVIAEKTNLDLRKVLSYPIIGYPLSLAHCDGSLVKTSKALLLHKLESLQTDVITDLPSSYARVYDGGLVVHSILSQTNSGSSYASIARTVLSHVCSGRAAEVHLCLDKYVENSIKDSERKLRGAADATYVISGPDQIMRQKGQKLLTNGTFKNELAKFLLKEWKNDHYWNIFDGKTIFASYGGECYQYVPDDNHHVAVVRPAHLQGDHEEADTLVAFHTANITTGSVVVRASDTDVLVILIGALGQQLREVRSAATIIMDCGMGNKRRYINVTNIADKLDEKQTGLARAMPGFHAFTGCDFTSAFYRKGKTKPFDTVVKDKTGRLVQLFISMGEMGANIDLDVASAFVCSIYAQRKTEDVNEARYNKLMQMTGKIDQEDPLGNIKRVDCALLPPCLPTLKMKIRRTQYVAALWTRAMTAIPADGLSPTDYGWCVHDDLLNPTWFEGPAIPDSLFDDGRHNDDNVEVHGSESESEEEGEISDLDGELWSEDSDGEAWSEDSDDEEEDGIVAGSVSTSA